MDQNIHQSKDDDLDLEIVKPQQLLDDSWFFGNLLQRKTRMLRSFSDPCTCSNYRQESLSEKTYEETYASIKNSNTETAKGSSNQRRSRSNKKTLSSNGLVRAPSLPTSLDTQELLDEEMEFSMGKLIRQASLNYSDKLPPRVKVLTPSPSMSRQKSRNKPELESTKMVGSDETKSQNKLRTQKSLNAIHFEDLGLDSDRHDSNTSVISKKEERRPPPYMTEVWAAQSGAPPVPRWGGRRSTDDMKAQIKFWARAVASNVRQEC